MKNITINNTARTIEMNKTFTKAASKFGSPEYQELQAARRDYPDFRVVTIAQKGAKSEFKGLTYDYMKEYIKKHDDANKTKMATFLNLRGLDKEGLDADADSADYSSIKEWFLDSFPAIKDYRKNRADLLEDIAKKKAQKIAEKKAQKIAALAA